MEITIEAIKKGLESTKAQSAWKKGVVLYAWELIDELEEAIQYGNFTEEDFASPRMLEKAMLNGASDWDQYSWGGCSLVYDRDIAERLCTATELKITRNGERRPNAREEWLDTQARALYQAAQLIHGICNSLKEVA